jgi:hypothetical protein
MTSEEQAAWYAERERRMAIRQAEQEELHRRNPRKHPLYIPVDDPEFPTEVCTAGWSQEPGA